MAAFCWWLHILGVYPRGLPQQEDEFHKAVCPILIEELEMRRDAIIFLTHLAGLLEGF